MQYPLEEQIGKPELFVGRKKELKYFGKWIRGIPEMLSKSQAILARKKSGKSALIERLFNMTWSENGEVIPFFISIQDVRQWFLDFAIKYYRSFASQYISFMERDEFLIKNPLTLDEIAEYGNKNSIKLFFSDVKSIFFNEQHQLYDSVWETAYTAPQRFAACYNKPVLVMIDEFQHLSKYIHRDQACENPPIESLPGSYHKVSESKIAPMLVTGSFTSWLVDIMQKYLEAGRLSQHPISPYLASEEGLEAVKTYARVYKEKITPDTAKQINELCFSDPFFIYCVITSKYESKDLSTSQGVIDTVYFEIANKKTGMSGTWREYIDETLDEINSINAKKTLLHMSKNPQRIWIPEELKNELNLDISEDAILKILKKLVKANLIEEGYADIEFHGLHDGTLHLVLRSRYGKEIKEFEPDIRIDFAKQTEELTKKIQSISGQLSNLKGEVAEDYIAKIFRNKKRFSLSKFFQNVNDKKVLNITDVRTRFMIQRDDGKNIEFDVKAESSCGRVILVEVKKWKKKVGINVIRDFIEKLDIYSKQNPDNKVLAAVFSSSGFSKPAMELCNEKNIGIAEKL